MRCTWSTTIASGVYHSTTTACFDEPRRFVLDGRPYTATMLLEDAGILVMDDRPAEVDLAIAQLLTAAGPQ